MIQGSALVVEDKDIKDFDGGVIFPGAVDIDSFKDEVKKEMAMNNIVVWISSKHKTKKYLKCRF